METIISRDTRLPGIRKIGFLRYDPVCPVLRERSNLFSREGTIEDLNLIDKSLEISALIVLMPYTPVAGVLDGPPPGYTGAWLKDAIVINSSWFTCPPCRNNMNPFILRDYSIRIRCMP
jgi:hypothetical protein